MFITNFSGNLRRYIFANYEESLMTNLIGWSNLLRLVSYRIYLQVADKFANKIRIIYES